MVSSSTSSSSTTARNSTGANATGVDYHSRLKGQTVYRSSDGAAVDLPSLWQPGERAVVAFGRSFG